jgi:GntR family transcriptional regulator
MPRKALRTPLEMHAFAPLYKQVEKQILQCLAEGEWKPGDQLPTESQLAERFGVAVFTIRAGIAELAVANILIRKQGKGTFVARHTRQRQRYQFSHVFGNDGLQIFPDRELISLQREIAPAPLQAILRLEDEARPAIFNIDCLLTTGPQRVATMQIALPAKNFAGLTARVVRNSDENLYAVYQDACGVNVIRIEERVHATVAAAGIARALKIRPASPLLRIERIAYTYNDVPVEFRVRHLDAAKYHYRSGEGGF